MNDEMRYVRRRSTRLRRWSQLHHAEAHELQRHSERLLARSVAARTHATIVRRAVAVAADSTTRASLSS